MRVTHRIAAVLLFVFCAGHTAGTVLGRSPAPAADAVLSAMRTVHFDFHGVDRTFYNMFLGLAALTSVYLAGSALFAWMLSSVDAAAWRTVRAPAWALAIAQLGTATVAWLAFFPGPALLSSAAVVLLIVGNVRGPRSLDARRL